VILHLATFTFVPDAGPDDVAALTADLLAMAEQLPVLRGYRAGENLRIRPGADYGVAALVDDEAALVTYLDSSAHKAVYERWLSWMIDSRQAVQLGVPAGTSL
jgi:hypothetical protein